MMKSNLLFFISMQTLLLSGNIFAQVTFQKTFGGGGGWEYGMSVKQTTDSGYIIGGMTPSFGAGDADVYLIKTDSNGDLLWTKTFGGTSYEVGNSLQQTMEGGYIITGATNSFGTGYYDVYLIKTNFSGNLLWSKTFGSTGDDRSYAVQQTMDSGYVIIGYTTSFGAGGYDIYLIKTNANGNLLWSKTFGGTNNDFAESVKQTTDEGYIITGYTNSFSAGDYDVYLIKTDSSGNLLWSKTFGGTVDDRGSAVQQTMDSGYVITGVTTSFGVGNFDVYLIKTNAFGDTLWTKTFGGTDTDGGNAIEQTVNGGYIITGYTSSFGAGMQDAFLIKTDSSGNSLWSKTFGGTNHDNSLSVQQTTDGGLIVTGYYEFLGATGQDTYLIKTDNNGNSGCNEGNPSIITTTPATQVFIPATIASSASTLVTTPSTVVGSGTNVSTFCTTVGINQIIKDNSFFIFPNPSAGNFIISFRGAILKGNVIIQNIMGEKVFLEQINNETKKEISIKNISQGIYFVKVFDGERSYCKKLIVE